jgi:hypothetical protein
VLSFLSCYVLHSFAQQQQPELPLPSFIYRKSNGGNNRKNYITEGGVTTYSCSPRKEK